MMSSRKNTASIFGILMMIFLPSSVVAMEDSLADIYARRPDLQSVFDADAGLAISARAGFLVDINDWATQYGWKEYPTELAAYAPAAQPPIAGNVPAPDVSATSYVIIDERTGIILAAKNADTVWPIASLTKLMTAQVAIASGVPMNATVKMRSSDEVEGARLAVASGDSYKMSDLFSAMLIGSANNAANAIARTVGSSFTKQMNARAADLHLIHTKFVDASGIDPQNVSTAREAAIFARAAFRVDSVRVNTTTATKTIVSTDGKAHTLKNTDWMLTYPQYDDVYMTGGKTGFLYESGWNFIGRLRPSASEKQKELTIVVFGSSSRVSSFDDTDVLANWVWASFDYPAL